MTRTARIAAGLVLIAGAIVLARSALKSELASVPTWHAWQILAATWGGALVAGLVGSLVPDRPDRGGAHRTAAFVLPAVGLALVLPLTLHLPIVLARYGADAFDTWTFYSVLFAGFAHVVFALLVGLRAAAIARGRIPIRVSTIYQLGVIAGGVPGVVIVIPMLLVALTGLPIVPLLHAMERWPDRGPAPGDGELPVAFARTARIR